MTEDERLDLRQATLSGARWIGIARAVAETTALVSIVVLARLIPPAGFGHAAVAVAVVALAVIIGPAGVTAPLVQRRSVDAAHLRGAAFLSLVSGGALTAVTFALAAGVGEPLFGRETARLLELASVAWLIVGVGGVSQALLQRELRFRRIAIVESASVLVGASTAVALALAGVDAPALVMGQLTLALTVTALSVIAAPPLRPRATREGLRDIGPAAATISFSSFVYSAYRNVDYAILAARLSPASVGYYWRAYQLGVEYQGKITQVMLRVSFAVYSRTESLEDLRRLRMRIVRVHATVLLPLLAAFIALAPVAIPWIFGAAWKPAVVPAQIMALAGMGDALTTGLGPLMVAIGRSGALLVWNLAELAVYAPMIFLLAPHGLIAVSVGVAVFGAVRVAVNQLAMIRPFIGLPVRSFVGEVLPGAVVGACVVTLVSGLRSALAGTGLPVVVLLAVLSLAALAIYVAALRTLFHGVWVDVTSLLRGVGGSKRVATGEA